MICNLIILEIKTLSVPVIIFFFLVGLGVVMAEDNCNHLAKESSPYLQQHATNPVCWYPWGEEAFRAAREQNKPIFLSIGYSTCYWCHVMEKDSFEIEAVAKVLNKDFISIKVDREERPDVDAIYMDAVVAMTGRGGWPLSLVLTPDLKPFWGGTFFYQEKFLEILNKLSTVYKEQPETVVGTANVILKKINQKVVTSSDSLELEGLFAEVYTTANKSYDSLYSGFGGAPKFPAPLQLNMLMALSAKYPEYNTQQIVIKTLESMAKGGLYDQIGGGFHRYAVDRKWAVPHFEKMLYDNAQLAWTYLEADRLYNIPAFKNIALETLGFIEKELRSSIGSFYSALDAGEVDLEGEYYVWTHSELEKVLSKTELKQAKEFLTFNRSGNFENNANVLAFKADLLERLNPKFKAIKNKLKSKRKEREYPHLDYKMIVSWSALAISAFVKAYESTEDIHYLDVARTSADQILKTAWIDNQLYRRTVKGKAKHAAVAEDYSFLIKALLDLYQADFNPKWLKVAETLYLKFDQLFWDKDSSGYFSSEAKEIIVKKKEFYDHVIPAANSIAYENLIRLNALFISKEYRTKLKKLKSLLSAQVRKFPYGYPVSIKSFLVDDKDFQEIAIIKSKGEVLTSELLAKIRSIPSHNYIVSIASEGSNYPDLVKKRTLLDKKETFYICKNHECQLPTNSLDQAAKLIDPAS